MKTGFIAITIFCLTGILALSQTRAAPVSTPTPAPAPPPTAPRAQPALAGTPVPLPAEPITPDNVDRIQQLAMWGKGRIEQLAYSPDGKILAVGTTAGVWLYDAETLAELRFINTGNFVGSLAFTGDGRKLVTDVGASTLMTWDVATGEKLNSVRVRDGFASSGAGSSPQSVFSEGAELLAATLDDRTVGLWEVVDGKPLRIIKDDAGTKNLAVSPDGSLLTTGGSSEIKVWDAQTGSLLYSLSGPGKTQYSLTFSPGDEGAMLLAVEGKEGDVQLWDARSGMLVHTIQTPSSSYVGKFTFSPDAKLLAVTTSEPSSELNAPDTPIVQIWQVTDETLLRTLKADMDGSSLIFSPDSRQLASFIPDGVIRRWDSQTGNLLDSLSGFGPPGWPIPNIPLPAFWSENTIFISNPVNNQIELWDLEVGQTIKTLEGHQSQITNLVLSSDGRTLASAELGRKTFFMWDPSTGENLGIYKVYVYDGEAKALAISPDGQLIAVVKLPGRSPGVVYQRNRLNDNEWYISYGRKWTLESGIFVGWAKGSLISKRILAAVSKADTGEFVTYLNPQANQLGGSLAFSPDSRILAVGTGSGTTQLWDTDTGTLTNTLSSNSSRNHVSSLTYSPDGRLLVAGMEYPPFDSVGPPTPTIELWDVEKGVLLSALEGYQANIVHLEFSLDGSLLAMASSDGTMRLWGIPPE